MTSKRSLSSWPKSAFIVACLFQDSLVGFNHGPGSTLEYQGIFAWLREANFTEHLNGDAATLDARAEVALLTGDRVDNLHVVALGIVDNLIKLGLAENVISRLVRKDQLDIHVGLFGATNGLGHRIHWSNARTSSN